MVYTQILRCYITDVSEEEVPRITPEGPVPFAWSASSMSTYATISRHGARPTRSWQGGSVRVERLAAVRPASCLLLDTRGMKPNTALFASGTIFEDQRAGRRL